MGYGGNMSVPKTLRFGIPSLDELFGKKSDQQSTDEVSDEGGILLPPGSTSSICIIGPDGAGKSVLGMHLASRYIADCPPAVQPRVFYVSTDLNHKLAKNIWEHFRLDLPNDRKVPF